MKKLALLLLVFATFSISIFAQEEKTEETPQFQEAEKKVDEALKYYKEKYEFLADSKGQFDYFDIVQKASAEAITDLNCQISINKVLKDDKGFNKGKVFSDYCVFSLGKDVTFSNLKKYSLKLPVIRGGIWENGRMQYKIFLTENEDQSVKIEIKGEISGMESFVTGEVHFWKSNGFLETKILENIKKKLGFPFEEVQLKED